MISYKLNAVQVLIIVLQYNRRFENWKLNVSTLILDSSSSLFIWLITSTVKDAQKAKKLAYRSNRDNSLS